MSSRRPFSSSPSASSAQERYQAASARRSPASFAASVAGGVCIPNDAHPHGSTSLSWIICGRLGHRLPGAILPAAPSRRHRLRSCPAPSARSPASLPAENSNGHGAPPSACPAPLRLLGLDRHRIVCLGQLEQRYACRVSGRQMAREAPGLSGLGAKIFGGGVGHAHSRPLRGSASLALSAGAGLARRRRCRMVRPARCAMIEDVWFICRSARRTPTPPPRAGRRRVRPQQTRRPFGAMVFSSPAANQGRRWLRV
jgi:hypothetical protein